MDRIIRCQPTTELRLRAEEAGAGRKAVGYAAVFNSTTTLYRGKYMEVREVIRPGAFRNAIAEGQDVRALWNHDPNHLLGRTTAGTLRLAEDAHGLKVDVDLPNTSTGRDVAESMARGDASQMSFAFLPRPGGESTTTRSENGVDVMEITISDVDLFDVSIVTYPAYKDTSVGLRSGGLTDGQRRVIRLAEVRSKLRALENSRTQPTGGRR